MLKTQITKRASFSVLALFFIITLSLSVASANYTHAGNSEDYRDTTGGIFTSDWSYTTKALTNGKLHPLVGDMNGDGTNEIIVIEEANVRIYQDETLQIIDAINIPTHTADNQFSDLVLYDIDADGLSELILLGTERVTGWGSAYIYSFNGSVITQDYNHTYENAYTYGEQTSIICDEEGGGFCVVASNSGSNTDSELIFHYFDESGFDNSNVSIAGISGTGGERCLSPFGSGAYADHDHDGDYDFFFTTYERDSNRVRVHQIDESSGTLTHSELISRVEGVVTDQVGAFRCASGIGFSATQPAIYDFDGAPSNGDEIIIGVGDYPNQDFKMYSFTSSGVYIDEYPALFTAEGRFMSNVIRMNAFADTGSVDFCVLGYAHEGDATYDDELDLLCASMQTGAFPQTEEFHYQTPTYNLSQEATELYEDKAWIAHGAPFVSSLESQFGVGTANLDEVVTSYGIFSLDYAPLGVTANFLIPETLFPNTAQASTIPVDSQGFDKSDVIAITNTNVYYFDDGFSYTGCASSTNPCIRTGSSIDPSPEAVIKQNSTLKVTLVMSDIDADNVAGRAVIYEGDANEQDSGWSAYFSSGTTLQLTDANTSNPFIFNKTGTYTMLVQVRDEREPTSIEEISLPFTVATTGIEQGDASLSIGSSPDSVASTNLSVTPAELQTDQNNNSIQSGLAWAKDNTGLGYTALWIIVMIVFAIFVIIEVKTHSLELILFGESALLILGAFLGFIGVGVLVTFIVVLIIIGALWITPKLMGGG